jgi:5-methylcytosine-specific restriction endonuclease McrA
MKFEEAWYFLSTHELFRKLPMHKDYVRTGQFDIENGFKIPRYVATRCSRHREGKEMEMVFEAVFEDIHGYMMSKKWYYPRRDKKINIDAPKLCARCKRAGTLERDHIVALHLGGKDVAENLQYLCDDPCHKFKTAEEKILKELQDNPTGWRHKMWEYRLKVLRENNPPGADEYKSYWNDPRTHYETWYERPMKKPKPPTKQVIIQEQETILSYV